MKKISFKFAALCLAMVLFCSACGEKTADKGSPNTDKGRPNISNSSPTVNNSQTPITPSQNVSSEVTVTEEARPYYKPVSLTMNFYDTSASSYGFTWNTEFKPIKPVIQVCEGSTFNESKCKEFVADVKSEAVYMPSITYIYVSKAVAALKQNTTYTYRAYDKGAKIGSTPSTFKTANFKATSFSFAHVSDSQVAGGSDDLYYTGDGTGKYFADTLKGINQNKPNFLLHTGDIVEYSKYETYWKNMLDFNANFLTSIPFMAISGNHETTYRAGSNELFKHFNHKLPNQQDTKYGYYYSFDYGNTKFIMLNTNNLNINGIEVLQYNWLAQELKNNKQKWTIVSMHHPVYSIGSWGADPSKNSTSLLFRKQLSKLFAEYKVDLVLQGHDHTYSKTYPIKADGSADTAPTYETVNSVKYTVNPTGTIYSMHGAAGNQSRSPYAIDKNLFEIASASKTNSWADIKVESDRITVKIMYYNNGQPTVYDSYGIIKR